MSKQDELAAYMRAAVIERYAVYIDFDAEWAAELALAWLGEQFDEGLREDVTRACANGAASCVAEAYCMNSAADAALAVARERLGLSDAAQDAQDGAETASQVGSGSECQPDASRPGEVQPCDSEGER